MDPINLFLDLDEYHPIKFGYTVAIDRACDYANQVRELIYSEHKTAESPSGRNIVRDLGAVLQLWKSSNLPAFDKPSNLGSALMMSMLGAGAGYGAGSALDWMLPNRAIKFRRAGALAGGALGAGPGLSGMALSAAGGQPILTSSFWDWNPRENSNLGEKTAAMINVQQFNEDIWNNPSLATRLPPTIQAAASGLITGAANLPGKSWAATPFVTPFDVARMAIGLGSGAASGYMVGKALGAAFGTSDDIKNRLIQAGSMAGLIKTVVPIAFGMN